jgi:16S rRNA (cytidine1402-2'-O)-methyltransferase
MSSLYVIGTPIGNLEDITLRAIRVLKEVDLILCEDTRISRRLLNRFEILNKQLTTYNEQKSGINAKRVIELLEEGKNIALVTDAGTPGISDPGTRLVQAAREAGFSIVAIPGPSAVVAALSASGVPSDEFLFLGFLPHKKGRETLFKEIAAAERTVVFYESPHRVMKTLESLAEHIPERSVVIARELTKIHEEFPEGTPAELLEYFNKNKEKIRGEFVVIVSAKK